MKQAYYTMCSVRNIENCDLPSHTQCNAQNFRSKKLMGVPYNIASYSLLTSMVAEQCDLEVGDFVWTGGDCHIYSNHREQVRLQLSREPYALPQLIIKRRPNSILDYKFEDFELVNYQPHPSIAAPVAV
jgi:thymidylate synthase